MKVLVIWRRIHTNQNPEKVFKKPEIELFLYLISDPEPEEIDMLREANNALLNSSSENDAAFQLSKKIRHGKWSNCKVPLFIETPIEEIIDMVVLAGEFYNE